MLRLLADEDFNGDIVRGLLRRQPDLDLVRVQDVGLAGADDPDILAWAAENNRIVLTHDRATMSDQRMHEWPRERRWPALSSCMTGFRLAVH